MKNERMTSVKWHQDVRHIEVLLQSKNIVYQAGDIAVIYPENIFDVEVFETVYTRHDRGGRHSRWRYNRVCKL